MRLYYTPGACSLATRISLHEAGIAAEFERVDLATKITEHGHDYRTLNPKGSVPMLVLDDGSAVTENVAILDLLAQQDPELGPGGPLGRTRLIEMLAYLSSELHVAFKPFWHGTESEKAEARAAVSRRLEVLESHLGERHLLGPRFTVADAYLFVMLRWATGFGLPVSSALLAYSEDIARRPAVRRALAEEGLAPSPAEAVMASPNGELMT